MLFWDLFWHLIQGSTFHVATFLMIDVLRVCGGISECMCMRVCVCACVYAYTVSFRSPFTSSP